MFKKMKKIFSIATYLALNAMPLIFINVQANTLYRYEGAGSYGGDAYQDSSGKWYDDDPMYGDGPYGGGVIVDEDGNNNDCDRYGECIPW